MSVSDHGRTPRDWKYSSSHRKTAISRIKQPRFFPWAFRRGGHCASPRPLWLRFSTYRPMRRDGWQSSNAIRRIREAMRADRDRHRSLGSECQDRKARPRSSPIAPEWPSPAHARRAARTKLPAPTQNEFERAAASDRSAHAPPAAVTGQTLRSSGDSAHQHSTINRSAWVSFGGSRNPSLSACGGV